MGRKTDTRLRMIEAAKDSFRTQGVTATGFTEVLERSGATRGAIYHHFPGGKVELAAAVVASSGDDIADLIEELVASSTSPVDAIAAFVEVCIGALDGTGGRFGCPIAPAVLESPDSDVVLDASHLAFSRWEASMVRALENDGWRTEQAHQSATLIIAAIEGAFVLARAARSSEPMCRVGASLIDYLDRAI
jgi:TetR/AcrR family transcriptional repressor of lmrAB and yxaGH operons